MNVTKKTFFYFFKQAQKVVGICTVLCLLIIGEFMILDPEFHLDIIAIRRFSAYMMMLYMVCQAAWGMYAISYYDSLILSFGARRKDVFIGEILREVLSAVEISALYTIFTVASGGEVILQNVFTFMAIGLASGAIMRIVGGLNLKHGRIVYIVLILVCALLGGASSGYQAATGRGIFGTDFLANGIVAIVGILIYICLQYPLHRIYKNTKVY